MVFSLLDHVAAMLDAVVYNKQLPFTTVLMDSWYATQTLMAHIDQLKKLYYCPLKTNRRVDDSGGSAPYVRVDELTKERGCVAKRQTDQGSWLSQRQEAETIPGYCVYPRSRRSVATNDLTQDSTDAAQDACGIRWKPIGVSA